MGSRHYIIPIFVPHYGCPNDCIFCNQEKITGENDFYDFDKVEEKIKKSLETINFKNDPVVEIAFYGGSFTAISIKDQVSFLKIANKYVKKYSLYGVHLSTRPDKISNEILDILEFYGVKTIELGVQSLNDEVLLKANRGHNSKVVYESAKLIKEKGFKLGLQMMIGLPGQTRKTIMNTTKEFLRISPEIVRIYPTLVIKGTALAELYNKNKYIPLSLEEGVEISKNVYKNFLEEDIRVIRIGLQPTKNIMLGEDVIAGPFHSSFRELVIGDYLYELLEKVIIKNELKEKLICKINSKDISFLIGNKKRNKKRLYKNYGIKDIKILSDNLINRGIIYVYDESYSIEKKLKFSL